MRIHDLPHKWRERAHGDAAMLACADELEASLKDAALCYAAGGAEVELEVILPDAVFHASITRPTSCTLSTKNGETRRAILLFD